MGMSTCTQSYVEQTFGKRKVVEFRKQISFIDNMDKKKNRNRVHIENMNDIWSKITRVSIYHNRRPPATRTVINACKNITPSNLVEI